MTCKKCGYQDTTEKTIYGTILCRICSTFAPQRLEEFQHYVSEKIDWKHLETFRNYSANTGRKQESMEKKAKAGIIMTRPPLGYSLVEGKLTQNAEASKVHTLFASFAKKTSSLNTIAKNMNVSTNGLKKILTNRAYLGEIKFAKKMYRGSHKPLISPDLFYAVQRALEKRKKK
jgi:hypothetical protein